MSKNAQIMGVGPNKGSANQMLSNRGNGNTSQRGRYNSRGNIYGCRNHHGGRNSRKEAKQNKMFRDVTVKLEGCTFGMYDSYASVKQYTNSIKKLKIHVYRDCTTDLGTLFGRNPAMPMITKPVMIDEQKQDETEKGLFKLELYNYMETYRKIKQEVKKMYAIVLGQCMEVMINRLKANEDYKDMNDEGDCARLLQHSRSITYLTHQKEDPFMVAVGTTGRLYYKLLQDRESSTSYYDTWINIAEVLKLKG